MKSSSCSGGSMRSNQSNILTLSSNKSQSIMQMKKSPSSQQLQVLKQKLGSLFQVKSDNVDELYLAIEYKYSEKFVQDTLTQLNDVLGNLNSIKKNNREMAKLVSSLGVKLQDKELQSHNNKHTNNTHNSSSNKQNSHSHYSHSTNTNQSHSQKQQNRYTSTTDQSKNAQTHQTSTSYDQYHFDYQPIKPIFSPQNPQFQPTNSYKQFQINNHKYQQKILQMLNQLGNIKTSINQKKFIEQGKGQGQKKQRGTKEIETSKIIRQEEVTQVNNSIKQQEEIQQRPITQKAQIDPKPATTKIHHPTHPQYHYQQKQPSAYQSSKPQEPTKIPKLVYEPQPIHHQPQTIHHIQNLAQKSLQINGQNQKSLYIKASQISKRLQEIKTKIQGIKTQKQIRPFQTSCQQIINQNDSKMYQQHYSNNNNSEMYHKNNQETLYHNNRNDSKMYHQSNDSRLNQNDSKISQNDSKMTNHKKTSSIEKTVNQKAVRFKSESNYSEESNRVSMSIAQENTAMPLFDESGKKRSLLDNMKNVESKMIISQKQITDKDTLIDVFKGSTFQDRDTDEEQNRSRKSGKSIKSQKSVKSIKSVKSGRYEPTNRSHMQNSSVKQVVISYSNIMNSNVMNSNSDNTQNLTYHNTSIMNPHPHPVIQTRLPEHVIVEKKEFIFENPFAEPQPPRIIRVNRNNSQEKLDNRSYSREHVVKVMSSQPSLPFIQQVRPVPVLTHSQSATNISMKNLHTRLDASYVHNQGTSHSVHQRHTHPFITIPAQNPSYNHIPLPTYQASHQRLVNPFQSLNQEMYEKSNFSKSNGLYSAGRSRVTSTEQNQSKAFETSGINLSVLKPSPNSSFSVTLGKNLEHMKDSSYSRDSKDSKKGRGLKITNDFS